MSNPLLRDLQELVNANILTQDTADKIQQYYRNKKERPDGRFSIVLGFLGALLVGSGIVLLVAHNWDEMPRTVQTVFAFLPLAIGHALCLFTLLKKSDNVAWRESSSVILFFAVASSMALVSQIYHITGTLEGFILNWLLLTVPLVYIMRSSLVSLLAIACATWYAMLIGYSGIFSSTRTQFPYGYVGFLLIILPHYYQYFKGNRNSNFFHLHNWFLVFSITLALGAFADKSEDLYEWIFIGYCTLFSIYYIFGQSIYFRENRLFLNPFIIAGILGPIIIFLIWSYEGIWESLQGSTTSYFKDMFRSGFFYISSMLLLIHIYLSLKFSKGENITFDPMRVTVYVLMACVLLFARVPLIGLLITNGWIPVIALFFIRRGAIRDHLGILNFGLLVIASLALLRFFDDSIGFIWRGLFFLTTGISFFLANYLLLKKRRSVA
ncbi:MAG TPA: DUF2157 domain-containing protein [Flavitalea sp.]|nr:DUF2157 domain-containing protein [Flavitalea sp.]